VEWLNYHHLLYFWRVAREGGLEPAARMLSLAPSTLSKQVHELERSLGHPLFTRKGRRLVLTESGRVAFRYAEEIFGLGRELQGALAGRPVGSPLRLSVGIADVVPKLVARRVLENAQATGSPVRLVCREDKPDRLLAELLVLNLDVILTDAPAPPQANARAFSHLIGDYGVSFFGKARAAEAARRGFPRSLDDAPVLLPTENTMLRRSIDVWLESRGIRPRIVGEFEDSALLMAFGQRGDGFFPAPTPIAAEIQRQYGVARVAAVPGVRERLYAVSMERRVDHPAVAAIRNAARAVIGRV
jgi:LysR family transcriptional regulator, transcriptional activator of nhaA